jgi:hypothetical protein
MFATAFFPGEGAFRVAAAPLELYRWPRGHGRGRYDDPKGQFGVRYLAETIAGCLKETLMPFRPGEQVLPTALAPTAEGLAETDDDLDDFPEAPEPDYGPFEALDVWLRTRWLVRIAVVGSGECADVTSDTTMAALNAAQALRTIAGTPDVREFLRKRRRLTCDDLADAGVPRVVTKTVSRIVFEATPRVSGIASRSCRDGLERCWTLFGRTRIVADEPVRLVDDPEGWAGLAEAAAFVGVPLPPWLRAPADG